MGVLIDGQWRDEELPAGDRQGRRVRARRQRLPRPHHRRRLVRLQGGGRPLSSLCRARLPVGAPHADLSRDQEARPGDQRRVRDSGPARRRAGRSRATRHFPTARPTRVNGFRYLHQAYTASDPHYTGKVTVPTLWDKKTKRIVNNELSEIIRMLNSEFRGIAGDDTDYLSGARCAPRSTASTTSSTPTSTTASIAAASPRSQAAYDAAYDALFAALDELEARLGRQRYLVGDQITEADWRLFPTLVRFDVAYFSLFKCNRKRIADYPNLSQLHARALRGAGRRRDGEAALLRDQLLFDHAASIRPASFRRARRSITQRRTTARG